MKIFDNYTKTDTYIEVSNDEEKMVFPISSVILVDDESGYVSIKTTGSRKTIGLITLEAYDGDDGEDTGDTTPMEISWNERINDIPDGTEFADGGFSLEIISTTGTLMSVDSNTAYFGNESEQIRYDYRLRTNGTSSNTRSLALTIPRNGTLYIYAKTASNSANRRVVVKTLDETELNSVYLTENPITVDGKNVYPVVSAQVERGMVKLDFPDGAINVYGLKLI